MRKSHWLWLCAAVAVGLAALLAWRGGAARSATLADGRRVTIEKITYGTNHQFVYANLLAKLASPIVPGQWKAKMGVRTVTMQTPPGSVVIWGVWKFPTGANRPAMNGSLMTTLASGGTAAIQE